MDQHFNWGSADPFFLLKFASSNSTGKEREEDIMAAVKTLQGAKAEKTEALEQLLDMSTTFSMAPIYHYPVRFPKTSGKKKTGDGLAAKVKRRDITISSTSQELSTSNLGHSSQRGERAIDTGKRAIDTGKRAIHTDLVSAVNRLQGGEPKKSEAIGQPMDIPTTQEPSTGTQRRSSRASKGAKYKEMVSEGLLEVLKERKRPAQGKPKGQGAKRPKAE